MGISEESGPGETFRRLSPSELDRLSDQQLVDYVHAARAAGEAECEKDAVGVLVNGFWPQIKAWVRMRTPEADVEDVAAEVVASLMRSTFDGKVVGEFGAFAKRIAQRRVADYFRERERRLSADPLGADLAGGGRLVGRGAVDRGGDRRGRLPRGGRSRAEHPQCRASEGDPPLRSQ